MDERQRQEDEMERIRLGMTHREYLDYKNARFHSGGRRQSRSAKRPLLRLLLWVLLVFLVLVCFVPLLMKLLVGVITLPFVVLGALVKLAPIALVVVIALLVITR